MRPTIVDTEEVKELIANLKLIKKAIRQSNCPEEDRSQILEPVKSCLEFAASLQIASETLYDPAAAPKLEGAAVKEMRLSVQGKKKTQKKAAEEVHRSDSSHWRDWESGRYTMHPAMVELFCLKNGLPYPPKS